MRRHRYFRTFPMTIPADSMLPGISAGYNEYGRARVRTDVE